MPALRSILLLGLSATSICRAQPQYVSESGLEESAFDSRTVDEWQEIVNSLPGDSLRAAIEGHLKPKYREGIFSDGHDAIQAVRSDDPGLASKLVDLAKHDAEIKEDLRKRQDASNTTTTTSSSSSDVVSSSSSTPVVVVTPSSSSSSQGQLSSSESSSAIPSATPTPTPTPTSVSTPANSSSSPVPVSSSSAAPVSPTTQTGVLVPVDVSTTASDGSVVIQTTQAFENTAPTSVAVAITTTNDQGQVLTTSSLAPAVLVTSTNAAGSAVVSAMPVSMVTVASGGSIIENTSVQSEVTTTDSSGNSVVLTGSPTRGGVYTATDAHGSVVVITYTPGGGIVSQLVLQTTTLANGQTATVTRFAEVGGATTTAPASSGSAAGEPGLQNGAAQFAGSSWFAAEFAVLFSLAIGMAGVLL